jgi:tRNA threonylcarbamoyladenosine biosynthesis protein TsaB
VRRLVIDTASPACSVALFEGDDCIAARHEIIGRGHAERLVPMIGELPERGRADAIAVNVGPGSFTGIRVGVSAARALAFAWRSEIAGYNGLALLAAIARGGGALPVDVAINGGHGEVFFQPFDAQGVALSPVQSLPPGHAAQLSSAPIVTGDQGVSIIALRKDGHFVEAVADARAWPLIAGLASSPASPCYVRGPDAKLPQT